ncbi:MAG: type III pantothenate kinase [Bacillota bacterium]
MIIVIDVGNTNTVLGLYADDKLVAHWRLSTDRRRTADEYGVMLTHLFEHSAFDLGDVSAAVIGSVVPPVNTVLEAACRRYLGVEPLVVGPGVKTGIVIKYDNPKEVGADRIVNAIAAFERYGGPLIVVDFGTATTFDVISAGGEYLGGAIAPGIAISTEALFQHAAKLPRIELLRPRTVIGKNTIASMQSGIIFGFAGQCDELIRRLEEELGEQTCVVATGGLADLIAGESREIDKVDPFLTLEGLRLVYARNRGDSQGIL